MADAVVLLVERTCDFGHVTFGGVVSVRIENVKEQLAELPDESVADAKTEYEPAAYVPGERVTEVETSLTLSLKVGNDHDTLAERRGGLHH